MIDARIISGSQLLLEFPDETTETLCLLEVKHYLSEGRFRIIRSRSQNTRIAYQGDSFLIPTSFISEILMDLRTTRFPTLIVDKIGVEFECLVPVSRTEFLQRQLRNSDWEYGRDGSIRATSGTVGVEFRSKPLKITEAFDKIKQFLALLDECCCSVNVSCGTHVHFSFGREVSEKQRIELYHLYNKHERFFDQLVAPSRRGDSNRYCQSCSGRYYSDRYRKLNVLCAWARHKTIEVRQHQGTLSYTKISKWIKLMCAWFEKGMTTNADNLSMFLLDLSVPSEWYLARAEELR